MSVQVGDVGTLYRMRVQDDGVAFDPTSATVKRLIFLVPGGTVLTKTASLTNNGSPATEWFLQYQIVPNDGIGSPPGTFHDRIGPLKVQGYLEWASGEKFKSDVRTVDDNGRELRVYANL